MTDWRPPAGADVAAPSVAQELLERAAAAAPDNGVLRARIGDLALDRMDFAGAAAAYEDALRLGSGALRVRTRLARCYNLLGRSPEAIAVLAADDSPIHERAVAFTALGVTGEAERELRAVLAVDPTHRHALRALDLLLHKAGRPADLLPVCEELHLRGVDHAQLFYSWGLALALAGEEAKARAMLPDRDRVAELSLPVPSGHADIAAFNRALADELVTNPCRLSTFSPEEEANRGSSRVHALFAGQSPELPRLVIDMLQAAIDGYAPARLGDFDPWLDARPRAARLRAWGLLQSGEDHEEWHLHRGGWLSGVYYVRVPQSVSAQGRGPGCIEFGPPPPLERSMPGYVPVWRHQPREGSLLLAPSHYPHRTIPSGVEEYRISFAFDMVPDD